MLWEPKGSIGFLEKILQGPTSRTPGVLVVSDHMTLVSASQHQAEVIGSGLYSQSAVSFAGIRAVLASILSSAFPLHQLTSL